MSNRRFRFTEQFDLHLAREVYGLNPYEDPGRWATIQVNMIQITGRSISIRTLRERIQNIVKKYLAKCKSLEGKSGIEIAITELDDLLQQISQLMSENQKKRNDSQTTRQTSTSGKECSYLKGYEAREQSCFTLDTQTTSDVCSSASQNCNEEYMEENIQEHRMTEESCEYTVNELPSVENFIEIGTHEKDETKMENSQEKHKTPSKREVPLAQANISTPVSKRKRRDVGVKHTTLQYLEKKHQQQHELRCRELALEERRMLIEEKKVEADIQERKKRWSLRKEGSKWRKNDSKCSWTCLVISRR